MKPSCSSNVIHQLPDTDTLHSSCLSPESLCTRQPRGASAIKLLICSANTRAVTMLRTLPTNLRPSDRGLSSSIRRLSPLWRTERMIISSSVRYYSTLGNHYRRKNQPRPSAGVGPHGPTLGTGRQGEGTTTHAYPSATTGLRRTPTPSMSISTTSPGAIGPTPDGVPVRMQSPGWSVMASLI